MLGSAKAEPLTVTILGDAVLAVGADGMEVALTGPAALESARRLAAASAMLAAENRQASPSEDDPFKADGAAPASGW